MESEKVGAVFFDIGATLADVGLDAAGRVIESFEVLDGVREVLAELHERRLRLGIISDRGTVEEDEVLRVLRDAGLLDFFDPAIILFAPKRSAAVFRRAANLAGLPAHRCLFVGENERERGFASEAGMRTADGPRAAVEAACGTS